MQTYVYFMQAGKSHIKIGVSDDPDARVRELQTGAFKTLHVIARFPFPSRAAAFEVEKELHRKFSHLKVSGEWFKRAIIRDMKHGGRRVIGGTYNNPIDPAVRWGG
jgi:predicted GIY-YIG superfamily endonuclease